MLIEHVHKTFCLMQKSIKIMFVSVNKLVWTSLPIESINVARCSTSEKLMDLSKVKINKS